ncbi:MAG: hypothetical protein M1831_005755 [Alyxoria varia]|nr:MAG: hypothetical protein M1831_005755 [Alyxoria varia]
MPQDEMTRKRAFYEMLDSLSESDDSYTEPNEYQKRLHIPRPDLTGQHKDDGPSATSLQPAMVSASRSHPSSAANREARYCPRVERNAKSSRLNGSNEPSVQLIESKPDPPVGYEPSRGVDAQAQVSAVEGDPSNGEPLIAEPPSPTTKAMKNTDSKSVEPHISSIDREIFPGQKLYFFPYPNDDSVSRRLKWRAIQRGAVWAKEWQLGITHAVVKDGYAYEDLLMYIRVGELPTSFPVVTPLYIEDCIKSKRLVDHRDSCYGVKGDDRHLKGGLAARKESQPFKSTSRPTAKSTKSKRPPLQRETPPRETETCPSEEDDSPQGREAFLDGFSSCSSVHSDPLNDVISLAKETEDYPTDSDDGFETTRSKSSHSEPVSSDRSDSECDKFPNHRPPSKRPDNPRSNTYWQSKFQCMQPPRSSSNPSSNGPNEHITTTLQKMCDYYTQTNDNWRSLAYRKAISTLRSATHEIRTYSEAKSLHGIGGRLASKIEEIAFTGRLRRLDFTNCDPQDRALQKFLKIYGVGFQLAERWARVKGYSTLEDVVQGEGENLTKNQRVGIERYDDFLQRISRVKVAAHGAIVRDALREIDPTFEVIVGGSYRRGAETSGDIDLLITRPGVSIEHIRTVVVELLVPRLVECGFITEALAVTKSGDGTKWHGACRLPAEHPLSKPEDTGTSEAASQAAVSDGIETAHKAGRTTIESQNPFPPLTSKPRSTHHSSSMTDTSNLGNGSTASNDARSDLDTSASASANFHSTRSNTTNPNRHSPPERTDPNPNPHRLIDILLVPYPELGAALIYFTGNDIFNRSLRLLARKKGMRLNQRGLYKDVVRGRGGGKIGEGCRVAGEDERGVLQELGVPWREPWEREL